MENVTHQRKKKENKMSFHAKVIITYPKLVSHQIIDEMPICI